MKCPRIEIDLNKIAQNVRTLNKLYLSKGIEVMAVTKVICGNTIISKTLIENGIKIIADSRLLNIIQMRNAGIKAEFLLLRSPQLSDIREVIKYTDMSLNSEYLVIKKLSSYAEKINKKHKIILMVELGDLREGLMPAELDDTVESILVLKGVSLVGLGTNLACFGGIMADEEKMNRLSVLCSHIEKKFNLKLKIISGGNSGNYKWFTSTKNVGRINNLRLGESIFLGCETLNRETIPGLHTDAFTLVAEVIESKVKPSLPYGKTCQNAFASKTIFKDFGNLHRVILGIGLQDVPVQGLKPKLDLDILGASSDHFVLNPKKQRIRVGDEVTFTLNYHALLMAMTSPYVTKEIKYS